LKKHTIWVGVGVLALVVSSELVARYVFGLGTPPLSQTHPRIEYLFKPNQDVLHFGHRILINKYGMRSNNFPIAKSVGEYRVMVFGDSVLNGGNLTDHEDLATSVLSHRLKELLGSPVIVGNISAGSWGPGNWLAYAQEYGFFGADAVVLVISSHDIADNPTFAPLNPNTHPQRSPASALLQGLMRYLPSYLPNSRSELQLRQSTAEMHAEDAVQHGQSDLVAFLTLAHQQVPRVLVLQHPERVELGPDGPKTGYSLIGAAARRQGAEVISLFPYMKSVFDHGENPYRDNIHVNDRGQRVLADALLDALMSKSNTRTR